MKATIQTDTGIIEVNGSSELLAIMEKSLDGKQPKCPEGCHDCCCAVMLTGIEADRIGKHGATRTEWDSSDSCEMLKDGRCSCYDKRPLTCRVYGCAPSGLFYCGKLNPADATITTEHADSILEGHFAIMVEEGVCPDMELIESCARHDTRTGLRSSSEDVEVLKKLVKEST